MSRANYHSADLAHRSYTKLREWDAVVRESRKGGPLPIFLSYARPDEAIAAQVRDSLIAWGYRVWFDLGDLVLDTGQPSGGYRWADTIHDVIRDAGLFVLCWSAVCNAERCYVGIEVATAVKVAEAHPLGTDFVVVLQLDETPLPAELNGMRTVPALTGTADTTLKPIVEELARRLRMSGR